MYILRSFFFLSLSSGAAPYERGGRRPLPEVLTAEIFPAPRPLRRDRLRAGQLMWPLTPSVHSSPSAGVRVAGQRTAGVGGQVINTRHLLLVRESLWLHKVPLFWARYRIKTTLTDGRIGWLCASVKWLCGKSCVHTHGDKRKKKNPGRFVSRDNGIQVPRWALTQVEAFVCFISRLFFLYIYDIRVPF